MALFYGRNYMVGRNHLTKNQSYFLCGTPIQNRYEYPLLPTNKGFTINEDTTCHACLKVYDPDKYIPFFKEVKQKTEGLEKDKINSDWEPGKQVNSFDDWLKKYGHKE